MNRYHEKPLVRLIECYILETVGQLSAEHRATLKAMEPKLQSTYKSNGTWKQIIANELILDQSFDRQIINFWGQYTKTMLSQGAEVDANNFAASLVDQNFDL